MSKYKIVPISPSRNIEDAIGRARNLSASEIWGDALAAVPETDMLAITTAEYESLCRDAERPQAAFRAVIEYMLGDGRHDGPLEFLSYWAEGDFVSVKEGWPEAPAAIYYADPLADHGAIDAAMQEARA